MFDDAGIDFQFDKDAFEDLFNSVDLTRDGKISKAEMSLYFKKMMDQDSMQEV